MNIDKVNRIMTSLFYLLTLATIATYFMIPENKSVYLYCGGSALFIRFVQYIIKYFI
ncbi:MAG: hypothetical protein PUB21_00840 [Bacteroidales bacterium]|nr:hypothetical protein [Bacteroidales bacterium]